MPNYRFPLNGAASFIKSVIFLCSIKRRLGGNGASEYRDLVSISPETLVTAMWGGLHLKPLSSNVFKDSHDMTRVEEKKLSALKFCKPLYKRHSGDVESEVRVDAIPLLNPTWVMVKILSQKGHLPSNDEYTRVIA